MTNIPNPIKLYIFNLLESGKITKEKICVLADIKYKTFMINLERDTVSPMVRMALKASKVVPEPVIQKYDIWFQQVWMKGKKHARKTGSRHKNKFTKSSTGTGRTSQQASEN